MTTLQLLLCFLSVIWLCCAIVAAAMKNIDAIGLAVFLTTLCGFGYLIAHHPNL